MVMDESAIRRMYDRFSSIPGFWELDAWTCRATEHSPYRARIIQRLGLDASSRVLDVACGTGLNFELLRRAVGGEGTIVGIDNSRKTLDRARRTVETRGWQNIELVETDAAAYHPDAPFDAALCTFAIDIIPAWGETIKMMIDAMRPNGRMGFIGFSQSSKFPYRPLNRLWRALAKPFGGVELDRPIRQHMAAGCDEVFYDEVYGGFYYLLVGERRLATR